jgi:putative flippase GtrA
MWAKMGTFVGFVAAGGTATVVNYALFASLYWWGLNYLLASAVGYVSGIVVSYTINKLLVFAGAPTPPRQFVRYLVVYLGALVVQLGLLELGVRLGLDPLIANAVALVIVVIGNYFVIRRVVFSTQPDTQPHGPPNPSPKPTNTDPSAP